MEEIANQLEATKHDNQELGFKLDDAKQCLVKQEEEIKRARREKQMRGYYNGAYNNAGPNGNFDIDGWNESIKNDR